MRNNTYIGKYLDFCKEFGVEPVSNYDRINDNSYMYYHAIEPKYFDTPELKYWKNKYQEICKEFKILPTENSQNIPACKLENAILRIIDSQIDKRFKHALDKIPNSVLKYRIKTALVVLYTQDKFVGLQEAANLFTCISNEEIRREFNLLGGLGKLPEIDEDIENDEVNDIETEDEEDE